MFCGSASNHLLRAALFCDSVSGFFADFYVLRFSFESLTSGCFVLRFGLRIVLRISMFCGSAFGSFSSDRFALRSCLRIAFQAAMFCSSASGLFCLPLWSALQLLRLPASVVFVCRNRLPHPALRINHGLTYSAVPA
jgi:hypothetical protein